MDQPPTSLFKLPIDVLESILRQLSNQSLSSIRTSCSGGKLLVDDELLWKQKVEEELNFPSNSTARTRGFQNLYRGLSRPHLLIWGEDGNGRLGVHPSTYSVRVGSLMAFDVGGTGGMPFPQKIDLMEVGHRYNAKFSAGGRTIDVGEGERVNLGVPVKLVAGGWSFHLLTSLGKVLYWGELDGERSTDHSGRTNLRDPGQRISKPRVLDLASNLKVKQLSCGRSHVVALAEELPVEAQFEFVNGDQIKQAPESRKKKRFQILEWNAWGEINCLKGLIPTVEGESDRLGDVIQLEAGWDFSAILINNRKSISSSASNREKRSQFSSITSEEDDTEEITSIYLWRKDWVKEQDEDQDEDQVIQEGESETLSLMKFIKTVRLPRLPTIRRDPFSEGWLKLKVERSENDLDSEMEEPEGAEAILSQEEIRKHSTIKKISAGMNFIIVLTETGLVWRLNLDFNSIRRRRGWGDDEEETENESQAQLERRETERKLDDKILKWELLSEFCLPTEMRKLKVDRNQDVKGKGKGKESEVQNFDFSPLIKGSTRITHISAHFSNFAVYSVPPPLQASSSQSQSPQTARGIVLISTSGTSKTKPIVISSLQNRGVIDVAFGDWHSGALTEDGEILTWGQWSKGALGIWDSLDVPDDDEQSAGSYGDHQGGNQNAPGLTTWSGGLLGRIGLPSMSTGSREATRDMSRLARPGSIAYRAREQREAQVQGQDQSSASSSTSSSVPASVPSSQEPLTAVQIEELRCRRRLFPQKVENPTKINLDYPNDFSGTSQVESGGEGVRRFAFDLAMAGWHSGALAVDLPVTSSSSTS